VAAEPWVSIKVSAKYLGVARESVCRWIEGHGMSAHKIGRLWRFKPPEVDQWAWDDGAAGPDAERVRNQ
jgi:excisionase family DNA binding protein